MKKQTRQESLISARLNLSTYKRELHQMLMEAVREKKSTNTPEIKKVRRTVQFWQDETDRHERALRLGI